LPSASLAQIRQLFLKPTKYEFGPNPPTFLKTRQVRVWPKYADFLKTADLPHGVHSTSLHNNHVSMLLLYLRENEIKQGNRSQQGFFVCRKGIFWREQEGHPALFQRTDTFALRIGIELFQEVSGASQT
jgi:hypothetical protein